MTDALMDNWRTIDTAPKDGSFFIVWDTEEKDCEIGFLCGDDILTRADCLEVKASHWMPFPAAPT